MRNLLSGSVSRCLLRNISRRPSTWRLGHAYQSLRIYSQPHLINRIHRTPSAIQTRLSHTSTTTENAGTDEVDDIPQPSDVKPGAEHLPIACPGCGAFTQWVESTEAGFYSLNRKVVKQYIRRALSEKEQSDAKDDAESVSAAEQSSGNEGKAKQNVESQMNAAATGSTTEQAGQEVSVVGEAGRDVEPQTGTTAEQPALEVGNEEQSGGTVASQTDTTDVNSSSPGEDFESVTEAKKEDEKTPGEVSEPIPQEDPTVREEDQNEAQVEVGSSSAEVQSEQESASKDEDPTPLSPPLCDRCHSISHHNKFQPISFPPISYIRDIMDESPFDHNHVYHIVDAADFPLSLISNIHRHLDVQELRPRSRRAKPSRFRHSKSMADLHIVITRADLLAPISEQVDKLMPLMVEALRDALGSKGQRLSLGNVHMVSAHRGWRTRDIKEQIWKHGGAVWMVGKTNVGKSNLINAVFPKIAPGVKNAGQTQKQPLPNDGELDTDSLLPPPQKVATYPIFPVISPGRGTTASPIRIPFGGKRGEVIDLPGLNRNGLEPFVKEKHKLDMVTTERRPKPDRFSIKKGQSLVLDQLVRITSLDPDVTILAAPFVPWKPRVIPTDAAVKTEKGESKANSAKWIANDDVPGQMASAGVFELKWDATRIYGDERHMKDEGRNQLYRLLSVDILIEGTGWVELLCQVRTKRRAPDDYPKVEVFSPMGKFIASRRSLCAWRFILEKQQAEKKKRRKRLTARLHGHRV